MYSKRRNKLAEIKLDDPLLIFFHNLLKSDEEKKVLSMIFVNYDHKRIIENIINYKKKKKTDD